MGGAADTIEDVAVQSPEENSIRFRVLPGIAFSLVAHVSELTPPTVGMLRPYPGAFWLSFVVGIVLGFVAARVRLSSSPLEGKRWVMLLGAVAGGIVGAIVFLGLALSAAVLDFYFGPMGDWAILGPTLLILLALFAAFALRRR